MMDEKELESLRVLLSRIRLDYPVMSDKRTAYGKTIDYETAKLTCLIHLIDVIIGRMEIVEEQHMGIKVIRFRTK